jgi:lysyl oxidase
MRKIQTLAVITSGVLILFLLAAAGSGQRTSVGRDFPIYANGGKPDLTVDPQRFTSQMEIIDRFFDSTGCAFQEGAVGGTGYRRILRFDTVVMNGGDGDLVVGNRSDPNNPYHDYFYFATCHGHYHIRDFSIYELLDGNGVVVSNQKGGFCFEDSFKYGGGKSNGYDCGFQGITSGWGDWYYKQLTGQWIDITGVPEGDYTVRVTINRIGIFDEGQNRYPDVVEAPIHVPNPRKKVTIDNSPELIDY